MQSILYYNGTILTMDGEKTAQAVLVEDGKIKAVGSNTELLNLKNEQTEIINLEGKTMLPAFIDPHSHFTNAAMMIDKVPLGECNSFEEIVEKLRAYKEEHQLGDEEMPVSYTHLDVYKRQPPHRVSGSRQHTAL